MLIKFQQALSPVEPRHLLPTSNFHPIARTFLPSERLGLPRLYPPNRQVGKKARTRILPPHPPR
ncbi:hypothetical protein OF83DRAFT_1151660 [Amylostereum chailletii]|nr:hypothetical protein OF83DRAFT_1151660 [Amylostereum chailletii]